MQLSHQTATITDVYPTILSIKNRLVNETFADCDKTRRELIAQLNKRFPIPICDANRATESKHAVALFLDARWKASATVLGEDLSTRMTESTMITLIVDILVS